MYRLIKVDDSKKMRMLEVTQKDLFGHKPATGNRSRGAFSKEIQEGQVLAFQCYEDERVVGGMLLGSNNGNIMIHRVYVSDSEMEKGAGSFMIKYIKDHKEFFDAYFGQNSMDIVIEPVVGTVQTTPLEQVATGRQTHPYQKTTRA